VFFGPYRKGQGLSASAGKYIGDEIAAATKAGGVASGAATMVRLLETDHLTDQLAALARLRTQKFFKPDRIAVAGNSFGGIEAVLGAERASYCAAIDFAGGAQSWASAPELQSLMKRSVRNSRAPISFFQAENDYDISPSRVLSSTMKDAGKEFELKIYPPLGEACRMAIPSAISEAPSGPTMCRVPTHLSAVVEHPVRCLCAFLLVRPFGDVLDWVSTHGGNIRSDERKRSIAEERGSLQLCVPGFALLLGRNCRGRLFPQSQPTHRLRMLALLTSSPEPARSGLHR
jgi:hypothetical protein